MKVGCWYLVLLNTDNKGKDLTIAVVHKSLIDIIILFGKNTNNICFILYEYYERYYCTLSVYLTRK